MKMKKILSTLLAAAIAITTLAVFAVSASAADVKKLESGKQYNISLVKQYDKATYKLTVNKSGKLKVTVSSTLKLTDIYVTDNNNNRIKPDKIKDDLGESKTSGYYWGAVSGDGLEPSKMEGKYKGVITYSVSKGTYYLQFSKGWAGDNNKLSFIATYPSADSSSEVKINGISLTLKAGDTLQLDADLSASTDDNVSWKSSDTSVAKVSPTGLVTAKKKGTAVITASIGSSSFKITIKVK